MNQVGKSERATQNRVIALFRDELRYRDLGDGSDRPANSNIDEPLLTAYLTGFDAPPCTYLYIDKSMQDHGLFQAICRTNRLDGEDKPFGYIVDYKDLFKKVQGALAVYTSELDHSAGDGTSEVLLQDRLKKGRERLDQAFQTLALLCEPVQPPKGELEHIHYFCGNTEIPDDLTAREHQRVALYQATGANLGSGAPEPGHGARVRHLQGGLDSAATAEAPGAGARDAARVSGPGEPLPLGAALPANPQRERPASRRGVEPPGYYPARAPWNPATMRASPR